MHPPFKNYPGNKSVSGLYQKIISLMPPHDVYIELFLGQGEILCRKKPAQLNIGNDIDSGILHRWKHLYGPPGFYFSNLSAAKVISNYTSSSKKVLFYADPPYLRYTRRSTRKLYNHEMDEPGHIELLNYASASKHYFIISGYDCDLYNLLLPGWNKASMNVSIHRGQTAVQTIWYNFQDPIDIHDYSYVGKDFTDRQRIKRKVTRWVNKFDRLPDLERNLIFRELSQKNDLIRGRLNDDLRSGGSQLSP